MPHTRTYQTISRRSRFFCKKNVKRSTTYRASPRRLPILTTAWRKQYGKEGWGSNMWSQGKGLNTVSFCKGSGPGRGGDPGADRLNSREKELRSFFASGAWGSAEGSDTGGCWGRRERAPRPSAEARDAERPSRPLGVGSAELPPRKHLEETVFRNARARLVLHTAPEFQFLGVGGRREESAS